MEERIKWAKVFFDLVIKQIETGDIPEEIREEKLNTLMTGIMSAYEDDWEEGE